MATWKDAIIVGRPVGNNDENANKGGFVISLKQKDDAYGDGEEVGRVAFDRNEGAHSDVPFNEKLDEVIAVARTCKEKIDELFEHAGELQ